MKQQTQSTYIIRVELCLIAVLVLALSVFSWPMEPPAQETVRISEQDEGLVQIEEVIRTKQATAPPPPPKPVVPVPVPNDEIIPERELKFEEVNLPDQPLLTDMEGIGQGPEQPGAQGPVKNPQQPPRIERIVEAVTPAEARKANIKAELTVSMLVDKNGDVEDASVAEIRLFNEEGSYTVVERINYGLVDATLKAAFQWKFKPAKQDGEPVKAYTNQVFSFGF